MTQEFSSDKSTADLTIFSSFAIKQSALKLSIIKYGVPRTPELLSSQKDIFYIDYRACTTNGSDCGSPTGSHNLTLFVGDSIFQLYWI
jgi:hypothetical protein